jgi:hypothetical protein
MNVKESTHLVLNFDTLVLAEETRKFLFNILEEHTTLSRGDLGYLIDNFDPGNRSEKIQQELLELHEAMGKKITCIISLSYR